MRTEHVAAAILAGGRAERLGGTNKALVEVGGRRMIDWIIASIGDTSTILVCAGPNAFPSDVGLRTIPDLQTTYAGPLAGVAAAVDALADAPPDLLLTVAVDTPNFPPDFAARALPMLHGHDVVVAAFGDQDYPTNALWRFAALARLPAEVSEGSAPHSLKRLISTLRSRRLDYAGSGPIDPFANANTPADLEALRARLDLRNRG